MRYRVILLFIAILVCYSVDMAKDFDYKSELLTAGDSVNSKTKKLAEDSFINGTILDMQDKYAEAILEYLDALKFDKSPGIYYAISKDYYRLGKIATAIDYAQKAVAGDAANTEYLYLLASIYTSAHMNDSAAVSLEKIIAADSTDPKAYFNLAQIYEVSKPLKALELYNKLLNLIGPDWSVLIKIADLNEKMGNVEKTVETVEQLLKLNPSSLQLQKLLIESYVKTKKYDEALKMVDDALTSYPDDLSLIEYKANALIQKGDIKAGAEEYYKLVDSKDVRLAAKIQIGQAFLAQADKDTLALDAAKRIFESVNKDTTDWQVNAYLGEIAYQEKNDSLAIEYFKTSASLANWNEQVWTRLGGLLFDNGKYEECAQWMDSASVKFPNSFAIQLINGLSLSQLNKNAEAEKYLKKAAELNPNDVTALSAYGFTLNQLKKDDEAIVYLNRALNVDPNNIQVLGMLGLIYETKKMYSKSDVIYEKAMVLDSTNALILNNYGYSLAERGLQLNRALQMVKTAIEKDPKNSSYLDTIGWIYFKLGDTEKAKTYIEQSLEIDGKSATVLEHLGDIYKKMGDLKKAGEYWNKALEIDPSLTQIKDKLEKGT